MLLDLSATCRLVIFEAVFLEHINMPDLLDEISESMMTIRDQAHRIIDRLLIGEHEIDEALYKIVAEADRVRDMLKKARSE